MEAGRAHAIPVFLQDGAHEQAFFEGNQGRNYTTITIPYQ